MHTILGGAEGELEERVCIEEHRAVACVCCGVVGWGGVGWGGWRRGCADRGTEGVGQMSIEEGGVGLEERVCGYTEGIERGLMCCGGDACFGLANCTPC